MVVEAVALVGRRIVAPGVQRGLDEAVGHGLGGLDDVGLAGLQAEAEEAGVVGHDGGGVAVGIGGQGRGDGALGLVVLVHVHADALEAALGLGIGSGHLLFSGAGAHAHGIQQGVDLDVLLRRAVGQDIVAVGDALEGDALGDAELHGGGLLVVGLVHGLVVGVGAGVGLIVGHGLHLDGGGGHHERRIHAVGMVGLDALHGEVLVLGVGVDVRLADGLLGG